MNHTNFSQPEAIIAFGQFNQLTQELAALSCNSVSDCTVDILLQDLQGRVVLSKHVNVNQSTNSISLDVSQVGEGNYHAWLSIGEITFVRNLKIKRRQSAPASSMLNAFARIFT